jgi:hypothetical protein
MDMNLQGTESFKQYYLVDTGDQDRLTNATSSVNVEKKDEYILCEWMEDQPDERGV